LEPAWVYSETLSQGLEAWLSSTALLQPAQSRGSDLQHCQQQQRHPEGNSQLQLQLHSNEASGANQEREGQPSGGVLASKREAQFKSQYQKTKTGWDSEMLGLRRCRFQSICTYIMSEDGIQFLNMKFIHVLHIPYTHELKKFPTVFLVILCMKQSFNVWNFAFTVSCWCSKNFRFLAEHGSSQ
jgi:hypothetical protein